MMVCKICSSDKLQLINALIVRNKSSRFIAGQFPEISSKSAVQRHRTQHIAPALRLAADTAQASELADEIRRCVDEAHRLRGIAEKKHDLKSAVSGLNVALHALRLYGEATGQLNDKRASITVNVSISPQEAVTEAAEMLLLFAGEAELVRVSDRLRARAEELHCDAAVKYAKPAKTLVQTLDAGEVTALAAPVSAETIAHG